jgi:hypothetical protein
VVRSRVRPVDAAQVAAGLNALRGSGPNRKHALKSAMTQTGSPDPRIGRRSALSAPLNRGLLGLHYPSPSMDGEPFELSRVGFTIDLSGVLRTLPLPR